MLCSDESMKYNLCISCNNDYSKIIDDETNINSFCDCIKISSTEYIKIKDSLEISTSFVELKEKEEKELEELRSIRRRRIKRRRM